ncbi:hypothetical protein [Streptomyces sp. Rer75]|nr:hypothetical protein [Streptomyces sp. Rer75]
MPRHTPGITLTHRTTTPASLAVTSHIPLTTTRLTPAHTQRRHLP